MLTLTFISHGDEFRTMATWGCSLVNKITLKKAGCGQCPLSWVFELRQCPVHIFISLTVTVTQLHAATVSPAQKPKEEL